jgi:hypothetical protein
LPAQVVTASMEISTRLKAIRRNQIIVFLEVFAFVPAV